MARGSAPHSRPSFYPPNDPATYRDLLFFEERLKTNAASLQRRKSRYQSDHQAVFLLHLVLAIAFLLSEVLLQTSFLNIPYTYLLRHILPDVYGTVTSVKPHPYFTSGLLFVAITTLLLFFASGMYSEKIAYSNRYEAMLSIPSEHSDHERSRSYVPHANKALRSFNIYLNVRKPPLRSKISLNPFILLFPRPDPLPESARRSLTRSSPSSPTDRGTSVPIAPIPPAANPRGELIFSSRVDRSFRESYERYRAAFERKRQERERSDGMQTWLGWLHFQMPWNKQPVVHPLAVQQLRTASSSTRGRGVGSVFPTPSSSRRSSPMTRASRRGTSAVCPSDLIPRKLMKTYLFDSYSRPADLVVPPHMPSPTPLSEGMVYVVLGIVHLANTVIQTHDKREERCPQIRLVRLHLVICPHTDAAVNGKRSVNFQGEKQALGFRFSKKQGVPLTLMRGVRLVLTHQSAGLTYCREFALSY
ncbi:hypothetical protein J3R83DRAFT_13531 [Lanmaoa asiatica]|nr:hypothetical protein J3R83DRAFT_13531 [Lanmaoa asiatica]